MNDQPRKRIKLKVCPDGDTLKVSWEDSTSDMDARPYFVNKTQFEDQALRCRDLLEQLADRFVNEDRPAYGDLVRQLAEEGIVMYDLLFNQVAEGQAIADDVKQYLRSLSGPIQITVSTDTSCHIPWALLYDESQPYTASERPSPEDFPGFWGYQYSIASLIAGMALRDLDPPRRREQFKLLLVFDAHEFELVKKHLTADELAFLERVWTHPAGDANSWDDARKLWGEIISHDSFLYVYGHGRGSTLTLIDTATDEASEINVARFRKYFSKRDPRNRDGKVGATVCFLNGCSTAVGPRDNSFRSATNGEGFYGFIGTEASISNIFALKFSIAFFYYLLEKGWAVQKIFDVLRRRHWPLSLTYTNLAHPLFKVEPVATSDKAPFDENLNFSSLNLRYQRGA